MLSSALNNGESFHFPFIFVEEEEDSGLNRSCDLYLNRSAVEGKIAQLRFRFKRTDRAF